MDFGLTVREEGAYILDCQVPGKAGLLGPLHVVLRQQDEVAAEHTDIRKKYGKKGESRRRHWCLPNAGLAEVSRSESPVTAKLIGPRNTRAKTKRH